MSPFFAPCCSSQTLSSHMPHYAFFNAIYAFAFRSFFISILSPTFLINILSSFCLYQRSHKDLSRWAPDKDARSIPAAVLRLRGLNRRAKGENLSPFFAPCCSSQTSSSHVPHYSFFLMQYMLSPFVLSSFLF